MEPLMAGSRMDAFELNWFSILPAAVSSETVEALIQCIEEANQGPSSRQRGSGAYAIRNLLETAPAVNAFAGSKLVRAFVEPILGPGAFVVRGLLFDKNPEANWKVAWHQDLSIAVRHRRDVPGFGPWSVKAGIPHVQPPVQILERMLTLRLHLDDCGEENGPLQVLPGSHRAGKMDAKGIQARRKQTPVVACTVNRGGLLLMRPLLLHASSTAQKPGHRRVVHLEYAAHALPGGLQWSTETCSSSN